MASNQLIFTALDYELSDKQCLDFSRKGHLHVPKLFSANESISILETLRRDMEAVFSSAERVEGKNSELKLAAYRHKARVCAGRVDADSLSLEECEEALSSAELQQDDIPFMQLFNLWRSHHAARALALSPSLAKQAAELLGVNAVRLYQDSVFVKRAGDGATRWHSDLNMCPFDTSDFLTCWIPLQAVPPEAQGGSGLSFASGSHRDFALPYC